ncbi:MAG: crossover junction endodeoxyribonuclease RuvC [Dehalococcoidia bacterium]|nr:crossover junction endodeoxyribonuclease RuvC [Dehalococcoidia bacterium]HRC61876.1 crossover junction endodeoxyribonuclease RuvC [Dehalococcoidia bacterium]
MRRVLGIDPGLATTGYGVLEGDGVHARVIAAGALRTRARDSRAARLASLFEALTGLLEEHRPQDMALEQHFVANNVRSAMAIGEARAAAMIAAARARVEVYEYPPATVKESVCGFGSAGKEQVQAMVRMHLGLAELPEPLDVSDALAVALTRLAGYRMDALLAASK